MLEAVNVSAEVVAAILGISITVVAIIVQLAATRYNHHITEMFVREPINVVVQAFFVLTTVLCIWVAALGEAELNATWNTVTLVTVTVALAALLPYFGYVFAFISPVGIIRRIRRKAEHAVAAGHRAETLRTIDQLQDVARSAIDHGDRAIAMAAVEALSDLFRHYRSVRNRLPEGWSRVDGIVREDPDFVALEPSALDDLDTSGLWVEVKIMHQYVSIIRLSVMKMHDVAGRVGIALRQTAIEQIDDPLVLEASFRGMNSLLRASLNARDIRTTFHLLSQYKAVAEDLVSMGHDEDALAAAEHIQSYGQGAFTMNQPFLLEVAAFDLGELIRLAHKNQSAALDRMLDGFLELDHEIKYESQEESLLGVRRAQMQLGAYLISQGDLARAQRVADDLSSEGASRLDRLQAGLLSDERALFWEFNPRGVNFSYLEPELRPHLNTLMDMVRNEPRRVAPTP
ncbi:MAG TPA: hypothetical protein VIS55_17810 [Pseudomonadales bacterium]